MSTPLNVNIAVNCKIIYDSNRCTVCDEGRGVRVRYACGHTACTNCASSTHCLICFLDSQSSGPSVDDVLTARVKNAGKLIAAYEDLFCVNGWLTCSFYKLLWYVSCAIP